MKYRKVKNSRWVYTGNLCRRCGGMIYVERMNNSAGTLLLDSLTCSRTGCTWVDYLVMDMDFNLHHKSDMISPI